MAQDKMERYSSIDLLNLLLLFTSMWYIDLVCGTVSDGMCDSEDCKENGQGGLDGTVNRIDLSSFPNYKEPGMTIDIIRTIAADSDYIGFGVLLLESVEEMNILENDHRADSVKIITKAFDIWIMGKSGPTPATWSILLRCLQERRMNTIADDIEKFFTIDSSIEGKTDSGTTKKVPSLWRGEEQRYSKVSQLLKDVHGSVDAVKSSSIGEAEDKMTKIAQELTRIENRLQDTRVRVGIIGLTKAGKSTFLNALLGKSFLPTSFDPQTANETVIIHDMSRRDGELYCVLEEKPKRLAHGREAIFDQLTIFNKKKRGEGRTQQRCDKLILYAPLQFLVESNMTDVKLELSDTPGFGEAGAEGIAETVVKAVKEMCAFILIINSNNMKSKTELAFLNNLTLHHQDVFEELNRILVLVNGHTSIYKEGKLFTKSAAISPEDLPQYVSDYLKAPEGQYVGVNIPREKITLFHALWALQSREWRNAIKAGTSRNSREMKTLYREAVLMLGYMNKEEEADALEKNSTDEQTVNAAISVLEEFSNIETIEDMLKKKVVDNGGAILLESAVDDTRSVITHSLSPAITKLIQDEHLETKQTELQFVEKLNALFNGIFIQSIVAFDGLGSSIRSTSQELILTHRNTAMKSLDTIVTKKLTDELRHLVQIENEDGVASKIEQVSGKIPTACEDEVKTILASLSSAIQNAAIEQLKMVISDIKTSFLSSLSGIDPPSSALQGFVKDLRADIPAILDSIRENSAGLESQTHFLAGQLSFPQEVLKTRKKKTKYRTEYFKSCDTLLLGVIPLCTTHSKSVSYEGSDFVKNEQKTKYRPEYFETCDGGFLGTGLGEDCDTHMRSIAYEVTVYAPNIDAIISAFGSIVQAWLSKFEEQAKTGLNKLVQDTITAGKEKLQSVLSTPQQRVTEKVISCRSAFEKSESNVAFLTTRVEELEKMRQELKDSLK